MGMLVLIVVFIFDLIAFALVVGICICCFDHDHFYYLMNVVFLIRSIIGNLKGFVILILVVLKWLVDFWVKLYVGGFCIEMV